MFTKKYLDFYLDQGSDFEKTIRLTDSETNANINIAGYVFVSKVRKGPLTQNTAAIFTVSTVNTVNGTIKIVLNSANTSNLEQGRYVYDILQTNAANLKSIIYEGTVIVSSGVSR